LARHLDALKADDAVVAGRTHLDLHGTLWRASGNLMLARFWPLVQSQILTAMSLDQATRHAPERDAELHQRLVDTISGADEPAIIAEVRRHIGQSADEVVEMMGSTPPTKSRAKQDSSPA
jgi:DNA-binding FadR family transcriptional regulator